MSSSVDCGISFMALWANEVVGNQVKGIDKYMQQREKKKIYASLGGSSPYPTTPIQ